MMEDDRMDRVFTALSKEVRRRIIDSLLEEGGQSLTRISELADISRQSFSQHLRMLEDADLVISRRVGRQTLHYVNPLPLLEIQTSWLARFNTPEARALIQVRELLEGLGRTKKDRSA